MREVRTPLARDVMKRNPQVFSSGTGVEEAVRSLLKKGHSGAPVVDASGSVVGVLSEYDCLGVLAQAVAHGWPVGQVSEHMTRDVETVPPTEDVFALATRFTRGHHRRLLVVDDGRLVGLITRRDLLQALQSLEGKAFSHRPSTTYEEIEKRHRALD
jgi:CBS domain-containing protein